MVLHGSSKSILGPNFQPALEGDIGLGEPLAAPTLWVLCKYPPKHANMGKLIPQEPRIYLGPWVRGQEASK